MKKVNIWTSISLFNFCIVGILGVILRSKIIFHLPGINYLSLLDSHSHFAFGGWITLALLTLFVHEFLPAPIRKKRVYDWLLGSILISSFCALLAPIFDNSVFADISSAVFIFTSYVFSWMFIKNLRQASTGKSICLLSTSSIICMALSSVGPVTYGYLHATGSVQSFLYRDALYIYLHFMYNGFFTLAVFALLFHKLYPKISRKHQQNFHWFSLLLCLSVLPSLFLSFLWQDPNEIFRIIAAAGSILVLMSLTWFIISSFFVLKIFRILEPLLRYIIFLSIASFILKMFLQSLTIFTVIGNAVYGDRPVIIGFLHLVFLGFVSLFILAYYTQERILNLKVKLVRYGLFILTIFVVFNEGVLMFQGLGAMFLESSHLFSWFLWIISIGLAAGAILIFAAQIKSNAFLLKARN